MNQRTVKEVHSSRREDIADLVTRRPAHALDLLNPFLFINHHGPQVYPPGNQGLPFGPHPHRGFETVTFIVEGSLVHRDTAGHESAITAGGIQWMTAGRGVEHSETSSEEFRRTGGPLEILQLWINLPARLKMTHPAYRGLQREEIPVYTEGSSRVHLIAGEWDGNAAPIESITRHTLMTIEIPAGAQLTLPAPSERVVFFYVVHGEVRVSDTLAKEFELVELNADGDLIEVQASRDALIIFGHADPISEPIAAYGPFVMNSQKEIMQTINDYQSGAFGGFE